MRNMVRNFLDKSLVRIENQHIVPKTGKLSGHRLAETPKAKNRYLPSVRHRRVFSVPGNGAFLSRS